MVCKHEFMTIGWDKNGEYRVCRKCKRKIYIISQADKVRGMSDEELANLLCNGGWNAEKYEDCLKWLKSDICN